MTDFVWFELTEGVVIKHGDMIVQRNYNMNCSEVDLRFWQATNGNLPEIEPACYYIGKLAEEVSSNWKAWRMGPNPDPIVFEPIDRERKITPDL